ncbi:MAG TPA: nucleotidyltransferase family protein [Syntrophomonadaceae bacterium]|jgi:molybdopterin-guanine dinucleotide biosynthesis protein A|nr:nucleotidyltransferase family protein [Syntrophomonadaceae bacterium]
MQYDAVILAGGESSSELKKVAPYNNEALIIIGGYPMIYYVYSALRATPSINNIVVSGPVESLRNILPRDERLFFVEGGDTAIETFSRGVEALGSSVTSKVLAVPTDIPFITPEAIMDFLTSCEKTEADVYYPVTSKEVNDRKYPGVIRTYVHLKDGVFTGGNLFLLRTAALPTCTEFGLKVISRRKDPLAIARLFGFGLVVTYLLGQLSIKSAEKRLYELTGIRGKGIISPYAEVGVDVDKPDDLLLAERYLNGISFER